MPLYVYLILETHFLFKCIISESPNSIELFSNRKKLDRYNNTIIVLQEGKKDDLGCISKGGYPQPQLRIFIGNDDVTNDFAETVVSEPSMDPVGLRFPVYEVTRTSDHFPVNTLYQGQRITCTSSIAETDYRINDSATLEVHCKLPDLYMSLIFKNDI